MISLPDGPFDVIMADPPWTFSTYSNKGKQRSAEKHYACMDMEAIRAMPVGDVAAKDSVLLLWGTAPMLPQQLDVMRDWGFTYVSMAVWDKVLVGLGYWFRNQHEFLLVGRRGKFPAPPPSLRRRSVFVERRRAHSQKPECVYEWVDKAYPVARKLDLFCRQRRHGWIAYGDQPDHFSAPAPAETPIEYAEAA
jgi:N6-adenosine-specific RNA methylase IME4